MVHDDVTAAWQRVTEQWDDAARHDAFMGLVAQHSCFAWAAARYKERAGDAIADQRLDKLRRAATATFMVSGMRAPTERTPYRGVVIMLIVMLGALLLALLVTKHLHDNPPAPITKPQRH